MLLSWWLVILLITWPSGLVTFFLVDPLSGRLDDLLSRKVTCSLNDQIADSLFPGCNTSDQTVFYLQLGPAAGNKGNQGTPLHPSSLHPKSVEKIPSRGVGGDVTFGVAVVWSRAYTSVK
jgi:hypothetical protein